jgi:endonuclease/exonuclease/phosphatase family metal-dependent hydrolase
MRTPPPCFAALAGLLLLACGSREESGRRTPEAQAAVEGREFTVLGANVRYGTADDGADRWELRRDDLLAAIAARRPDILGVQEALDFQVALLEASLPHHRRVGQGREGGTRGEHCALYIDARRFEVLEHGDFWLSESPDEPGSVGWDAALTRICSWARVREVGGGRELWVANAHFDHVGELARAEAAALVARRALERRGPRVVLGDFNAGERSEPLERLRAAGLVDTWRELHPLVERCGTFHAFQGGLAGEKIDYILRDDGLVAREAAILSEPGPRGRWPSDHHFVWARLAWR